MTTEQHAQLIRQIEFQLFKARYGLGMPYCVEDVRYYERLLAEAKAAAPDSPEVKLAAKLVQS